MLLIAYTCKTRKLSNVCIKKDPNQGFPGGSVVKNPPANQLGRHEFDT